MSDIQALTLRIQELNQSVDQWNARTFWVLVFAAVVAFFLVVTTKKSLVLSKQLSDAQAELIRAKDAQLSSELKDKDLKIADAGARAEEARQRAAELLAEIQPRDLTIEQQKEIGNDLRKFSGHFVLIWAYQDPECMRLGRLIKATLKDGEISSQLSPLLEGVTTTPRTGVEVTGKDQELVKALRNVFLFKGHLVPAPKLAEPHTVGPGMEFAAQVPTAPSAIIYVGMKPLKLSE